LDLEARLVALVELDAEAELRHRTCLNAGVTAATIPEGRSRALRAADNGAMPLAEPFNRRTQHTEVVLSCDSATEQVGVKAVGTADLYGIEFVASPMYRPLDNRYTGLSWTPQLDTSPLPLAQPRPGPTFPLGS